MILLIQIVHPSRSTPVSMEAANVVSNSNSSSESHIVLITSLAFLLQLDISQLCCIDIVINKAFS